MGVSEIVTVFSAAEWNCIVFFSVPVVVSIFSVWEVNPINSEDAVIFISFSAGKVFEYSISIPLPAFQTICFTMEDALLGKSCSTLKLVLTPSGSFTVTDLNPFISEDNSYFGFEVKSIVAFEKVKVSSGSKIIS